MINVGLVEGGDLETHILSFLPSAVRRKGTLEWTGLTGLLTACVFPDLYFDTLATCLKWLMFHFCKYLRKSERTDTNC